VDLLYSLIRQPAQAEKTDEHSRIQKAVTALGMNYSLGRNPDNEPEIFLMPTAAKLLKMVSVGLELLETAKGDVELATVQKFQGLVTCLSVLALTRLGSNSTKTIAAFADEKNLKLSCRQDDFVIPTTAEFETRRLNRCGAAKKNLDDAVTELTDA